VAALPDAALEPERWFSTNLVGLPAGLLGSAAFNAHPQALAIAGVREAHRGLFALLETCADAGAAGAVFSHYMDIAFQLRPAADVAPRRRASYARLLQGWGADANAGAGAVLKGWVESRYGLVPSYHGAPLRRFPSPAWVEYLEQKAGGRHHNNNIWQQLDLLYEFCQWSLRRFGLQGAGAAHVRLWRGSNRAEEQIVGGARRRVSMRLNNLVSFSLDRDAADCFGDFVFSAEVPLVKLLLYPGLLPGPLLQGEREVLALGGVYEVEVCDV
jgi:NAD+--dinitrogen-reductase ADP-D-ribosyltransferase